MDQIGQADREALKQRQQLFAQADAACLDSQIPITLDLADPVDAMIDKIHKRVRHLRVHQGHGQPHGTEPIDKWFAEVARLNNYLRVHWTALEKGSLVALLRHLEEALQSLLSSPASQMAFTPVPRQSMTTEVAFKVNALLVSSQWKLASGSQGEPGVHSEG